MQTIIDFFTSYPELSQAIGVLGFMIYVGGFFSIQSGLMCGNGICFPVLQVIAASCVLISLTSAYNLAAFMIQTSYIAIGLFGIVIRCKRPKSGQTRPFNPL